MSNIPPKPRPLNKAGVYLSQATIQGNTVTSDRGQPLYKGQNAGSQLFGGFTVVKGDITIPSLSYIGLTVSVQPSAITLLDVETFSLVCSATVPRSITSSKEFVWRTWDGTILSAGAGVTITNINLNDIMSSSVLTVNSTMPGVFSYTCEVTVQTSESSDSATVTVNGMSARGLSRNYRESFVVVVVLFVCLFLWGGGGGGGGRGGGALYSSTVD